MRFLKPLLRAICLLAGVALLGIFLTRADWSAIRDILARLGWLAPLAVFPYLAVYAVDTAAWAVTLPSRGRPGYGRLFRIRWAGEAVNNLVPTGYVGGEAVKVLLLRRSGVSATVGTTAALVSKTAQTLAQVGFVLVGALLFTRLAPEEARVRGLTPVILVAGLVVIGGLVVLQHFGIASIFFGIMDRLRLGWRWIEARRTRLLNVDQQLRRFYEHERGRFLLSTALFFCGWLLDAVEVFLLGRLMGIPITVAQALAIEAFIGVAKIVGLAIPGAMGVQESGVVILCRLAGLPEPFGFAYALWRRLRELGYAGVGWLLLWAERADLREAQDEEAGVRPGS